MVTDEHVAKPVPLAEVKRTLRKIEKERKENEKYESHGPRSNW